MASLQKFLSQVLSPLETEIVLENLNIFAAQKHLQFHITCKVFFLSVCCLMGTTKIPLKTHTQAKPQDLECTTWKKDRVGPQAFFSSFRLGIFSVMHTEQGVWDPLTIR